jgi:hypothetical protein
MWGPTGRNQKVHDPTSTTSSPTSDLDVDIANVYYANDPQDLLAADRQLLLNLRRFSTIVQIGSAAAFSCSAHISQSASSTHQFLYTLRLLTVSCAPHKSCTPHAGPTTCQKWTRVENKFPSIKTRFGGLSNSVAR